MSKLRWLLNSTFSKYNSHENIACNGNIKRFILSGIGVLDDKFSGYARDEMSCTRQWRMGQGQLLSFAQVDGSDDPNKVAGHEKKRT